MGRGRRSKRKPAGRPLSAAPAPDARPAKQQPTTNAAPQITGSQKPKPPNDHALRGGLQGGPRTLDLVIGLDFGTAYTKCVVRAPAQPGDPTFAIPLSGRLQEDGLLVPSQVYRRDDGVYSLEAVPGAERVDNLKAPLIFGTSRPAIWEDDVVAFLALIIRRVRQWMLEKERLFIRERTLRWALNLGLPAASHDNTPLAQMFLRFGHLAWSVSAEPGSISVETIQEVRGRGREATVEIAVVPEVAAAVTGYARSRQRHNGLHLLVDVGAGTFDVCAFNLHDDGGDRISILQAEVAPLGVLEHQQNPKRVGIAACSVVRRLLEVTRSRRYPNSETWTSQLRYFMTGGGRTIPEYRQSIPRGGPPFFEEVGQIAVRSLKPNVSDEVLRRLIVAWGLSYDAPNIGQIRAPHTIADLTAKDIIRTEHKVTLVGAVYQSGLRYDQH